MDNVNLNVYASSLHFLMVDIDVQLMLCKLKSYNIVRVESAENFNICHFFLLTYQFRRVQSFPTLSLSVIPGFKRYSPRKVTLSLLDTLIVYVTYLQTAYIDYYKTLQIFTLLVFF